MPFVSTRGQRLAYHEREGDSRAIVFVHGAGTSAALWRRAWPWLSRAEGARLLAIDLPGHGRSDGPPARNIEASREVLRAFVVALGLERPVLVGHSMGGAVCLDYARAYPGESAALGLVSTAAALRGQAPVLEVLADRAAALWRFLGERAFDAALDARDALAAARELITADVETLRADFAACEAFDLGEHVAELKLPCIVVCGAGDRVTEPERSRRLAAALERSELRVVEGAGHMLPFEQPARLAGALLEHWSSARFVSANRGFSAASWH